jgi:hypothetical protein
MEATLRQATHRTPAFRQYVQVVWGYGTLIDRALTAGENPRPFVSAIIKATERQAIDF